MKIMLSCRAMANMAGGVERMAIALMHAMLERGHDVSLLTWDAAGSKAFFDMDPRITWHQLGLGDPKQKAGWRLRLQRMQKVRETVRADRPDVLIAFQEGAFVALRLYLADFKLKMICAERNAPQRFTYQEQTRGKWYFRLMALAHAITVQLPSYVRLYPWYLQRKMHVIPNPVFAAPAFADAAGSADERKKLLCIARLDYQKNQGVLIEAFAKLAARFPQWDMVLAGEGRDRKALEDMVSQYGLQSRITLPGTFTDVTPLYTSSHLFCLPSRWEGFPNNLAEAFAHRLPAVGFAGCAGINELIVPNVTGALASGMNNADTLAKALADLMEDDAARARMGLAAQQQMEAYKPAAIFDTWEKLFKEVTAR